jgi:acyl dehydratase
MSENAQRAFEVWKRDEGKDEGTGEWFKIDQKRIDLFADVTEDHQFIHIDPERAKSTPFGTTIAHGFLTLSMLTKLAASLPSGSPGRYAGMVMGINYGFDRVRFVSPVKVGSRIRVNTHLKDVELKGNAVQVVRTMTVEIEGSDKPALVADWVVRSVFG